MIVLHYNFLYSLYNIILPCLPFLIIGMILETPEGNLFINNLIEKIINFFDKIIDRFLN